MYGLLKHLFLSDLRAQNSGRLRDIRWDVEVRVSELAGGFDDQRRIDATLMACTGGREPTGTQYPFNRYNMTRKEGIDNLRN